MSGMPDGWLVVWLGSRRPFLECLCVYVCVVDKMVCSRDFICQLAQQAHDNVLKHVLMLC